jgi:hypothetical protein
MARGAPDKVRLVRTEELSKDTVQEEIFRIAKAHGQISSWRLNIKGDGKKIQIQF